VEKLIVVLKACHFQLEKDLREELSGLEIKTYKAIFFGN
jgi:hypothetical protein